MTQLNEQRIKELLDNEQKLKALQMDVDAKKLKELRYAAKQSILVHKAKMMFGVPKDHEADQWLNDREKVKMEINMEIYKMKEKKVA